MRSSVSSIYSQGKNTGANSRRLLTLIACTFGVLLLLYVPFRVMHKGKRTQIVYAPVWDPPQVPDKYTPKENISPDGGLFVPLLLAEFAALTVGMLIVRDRISRNDEAKLESYPGYQRGF